MIEIIDREKNEMDVNMLSPLTWAYVGDAVYELYDEAFTFLKNINENF